jgi:xylulokinase
LEAGEVAATAGTSGVIYGVHDTPTFDPQSRINSFAHVNHTETQNRIGVLLCINGTGILNRWMKNATGNLSYQEMNNLAASVPVGSKGLKILPFGNGAERMLENKIPGAQIQQLDLNIHTSAHLYRAAQEGIAFAFRYGLDIMRENNMHPKVIRAGMANMFLSNVFTESFVNTLNIPVELYHCDGSVGAALGAGIGSGYYRQAKEAFSKFASVKTVEPQQTVAQYDELYQEWKTLLSKYL